MSFGRSALPNTAELVPFPFVMNFEFLRSPLRLRRKAEKCTQGIQEKARPDLYGVSALSGGNT